MRVWAYHESKPPQIVTRRELKKIRKEGWTANPASLAKLEDFGIEQHKTENGDEQETLKAQQALEQIEAVKNYLNDLLNLKHFKKERLIEFGLYHFDIALEGTRPKIIKQIEALANDNSAEHH